jgi:hypothetical protein
MEKIPTGDLELLVQKAREVRSALLLTGEGREIDAKRYIAISELTEKLVVFRELVIQGKQAVPPRLAEFLKTKNYVGFKEALDEFRELAEIEAGQGAEVAASRQARQSAVKSILVGSIEDFLLSL